MPADQLPEGTDTIIAGAGVGALDDRTADTLDEAMGESAGSSSLSADAARGSGGETSAAPFFFAGRIEALKGQAGDQARDLVQGLIDRAGGGIDEMARMIEDAAAEVDAKVGSNYGDYVRTAAASVSRISEAIKGKDADAIFADAGAFVRQSPGVAVGIAATLGFVIARLARAGLEGLSDQPSRKAA